MPRPVAQKLTYVSYDSNVMTAFVIMTCVLIFYAFTFSLNISTCQGNMMLFPILIAL